MAERKLGLTRDQLAGFLKTHEEIKQFEKLFDAVNIAAPLANDSSIESATALATANEALTQLTRIANALELIATGPATRNDNMVATDYVDFPDSGTVITKDRRIGWNKDDGTLDVGIYDGEVLQVGQETCYYAKNTSGGTINKGTPVMLAGALGASGKLKFAKAVANGSVAAEYMMGVAMHNISNNAFGYVTSFGLVKGFNTTGTPYGEVWADGDLLYFGTSAAGTWTKVEPAAPNIAVAVAIVVHASAGSGSIFVKMETSESLNNLQDVHINGGGPTNFDTMLYNNANSRWENYPASAVQVLAWVET